MAMVVLPMPQAHAAPVPVHIFTFNDFHGYITGSPSTPATSSYPQATQWAYTLLNAVSVDPGNSMVVSAGDNIGASQFASFIAHDDPTIQLLNDIANTPGVNFKASAVGNHEFDQGLADLQNRVQPEADFTYLGANVIDKATGQPAFPPYYVYTLADSGIKVGVVGVVTTETPSLVSPAGIATLQFTDPVAAVNKYADQLKSTGAADIVIAVYHDGSPVNTNLADGEAMSPSFTAMVNNTDSNVAAIVNGHTHQIYAWDAKGRPVVQAGNYGAAVGRIDLSYDTTTKTVTSAAESTIALAAPADVNLSLPGMSQIDTDVNAALNNAVTLGAPLVGKVSADITTAFSGGAWTAGTYTGGTRDDRANESTLATLVANAFLYEANVIPQIGGADIGIINAGGGLRSELYYGDNGTISYSSANAVAPFGNNMSTVELTGAQFKQFLEEQWQVLGDGTRPTRPFLATGLSDNVTFTVDTDQPLATPCVLGACTWNDAGSHITSVYVNGKPLQENKLYKIVTLTYLTTAGDNYWVAAQGKNITDTGLLDRDVWIDYLLAMAKMKTPGDVPAGSVTPDFARASVVVSNLTPATKPMAATAVNAGDPVTASLSRLNLTSLGSPANTAMTTYLVSSNGAKVSLGTVPVTAPDDAAGCAAAGVPDTLNPLSTGCALLSVTIPANTKSGSYTLLSVVSPSGTTISLPLTVKGTSGTYTDTGGQVSPAPIANAAWILMVCAGAVLIFRRVKFATK